MKAVLDLIRRLRLLGGIPEQKATALDKRRLERLLRDEGLTRTVAMRVVRDFFTTPKT